MCNNKLINIILLLWILTSNIIYAQSFLNISSFNNKKIAVGISENYYLNVSYKPSDRINIIFNNSIFIEKIQYQYFYLNGYYRFFSFHKFNLNVGARIFGSYHEQKSINYFFTFETPNILDFKFSSDVILNTNNSKNLYYRLGLLYDISNDFKLICKYGLPEFSFPDKNYISAGFIISEHKLLVEFVLSAPEKLSDIVYSRISTSFLYEIF